MCDVGQFVRRTDFFRVGQFVCGADFFTYVSSFVELIFIISVLSFSNMFLVQSGIGKFNKRRFDSPASALLSIEMLWFLDTVL